jgi:alkylation response protein AidB-like acyl-CoA dehydrogenase
MRGGTAPEQALMKAFSSESLQRVCLAASEMLGADGVDSGEHTGFDHGRASWLERYFGTFAGTISAGSSEIQRNIIAEKVLGLPRS